MYITVKGLEDIDNQEEFDYHESIVNYFKSLLEDELLYTDSRFPHLELTFQYYPELHKFKEIEIPRQCKTTLNRVKQTSHKLKGCWY